MDNKKPINILIILVTAIILALGVSYISTNNQMDKKTEFKDMFSYKENNNTYENKSKEKNESYDEKYIKSTLEDLIKLAKEPVKSGIYVVDKEWLDNINNPEKIIEEFKIPERDIILQNSNGNVVKIISYPNKNTKIIKHYDYNYWTQKDEVKKIITIPLNDKGMSDGEYLIMSEYNYDLYGFYKNGILQNKEEKRFHNGDKELRVYENGINNKDNSKIDAIFYFVNGDREIFKYNEKGIVDGDAEYIYADGTKEKYRYINGTKYD